MAGRSFGDVVGTGAWQDRAAARVPALESEWSLACGEDDPASFSVGRGPPRARGRGSPVAPALSPVRLVGVTAADLALGHDQSYGRNIFDVTTPSDKDSQEQEMV